MTIAEILRAAKARLEASGWCHGDHAAWTSSRCCAATAIGRVIPPPDEVMTPANFFRNANGITTSLGQWNDAPERTYEEVLAAYDTAIAKADQDGV
jgi:hypothetical protein